MRSNSDEKYVLDLLRECLNEDYEWQKRFDTLRGDAGKNGRKIKLPVDAYFPISNIIVEYKEKQHFQAVNIMDKRMTISGVNRGEQRRIYDARKEKWAKDNNIKFLVVAYHSLKHDKNGRLLRYTNEDMVVIRSLVNNLNWDIIKKDIERLCIFIPYFETATKQSVCNWRGGSEIKESFYEMSYPDYDNKLLEFISNAYNSNLMKNDYMDVINSYGLDGDEQILEALDAANLELTKAILTGYIRQERFCDGLWAEAVEKKIFLKLLRRLKEISAIDDQIQMEGGI